MKFELVTGEGKKGTWYAVIFKVNKYKSDMLFIDELYYDYLSDFVIEE